MNLYDENNPLLQNLMWLSPLDAWTGGMACEGTLVTGSPGSGKSSIVARKIALQFLKAGMGGLVLVAKAEETENWITYARLTGRQDDLIIFSEKSKLRFDPLAYEWDRPGRGGGDLEAIIEMFTTWLSIGRPRGGQGSNDRFWELAAEQLMRAVLVILALAGEPISIANISRFIKTMPIVPDEWKTEEWQQRTDNYCGEVIAGVRSRQESLNEHQWNDLDTALFHVTERWPRMDPEPRGSIEMTWSGMADQFLFHPYREVFCAGACDFTPEDVTERNRIVICDWPMLEYGQQSGRMIGCLIKLVFQRAWLRRKIKPDSRISFLFADEFQMFLLGGGMGGGASRDNRFQQACRGSRIAVVYLTQNILNLAEELGEHSPGSHTKSFCANFLLRIFLNQNCPDTNLLAAELIGKEYRFLQNVGFGGEHPTFGQSETLLYRLDPHEFTQLRKPDPEHRVTECILYQGGRTFNITHNETNPQGLNFLLTSVPV